MTPSDDATGGAGKRRGVVLLGASNLTLGFAAAVETARHRVDEPVDILAAHGHGRSYGQRSRVLARTLPSLIDSGLWARLEASPPGRTCALVTDLGNDIVYGAALSSILDWLDTCLDRLVRHRATITLCTLPLTTLGRLSPRRFAVARSILFPGRDLTLSRALDLAGRLDEAVRERARHPGVTLCEPDPRHYGFDAIHVRRRYRRAAWIRQMARWPLPDPGGSPARLPLAIRWRLHTLRPDRCWWFGRERHRPQPGLRLLDGTTVGVY